MWEAFKDLIFQIIAFFYGPAGDWGLAIIIVTVIFRLIITPLMYTQTRSTFMMQKLQPEINRVQQAYASDPQRMQSEVQKIYAEAKFNPIMGCLPILLQMPIFIALFQVLREMDKYVGEGIYCFYNILPDLVLSPGDSISANDFSCFPYIAVLIVFAGATFLPMILQQKSNPDPQQRKQTMIMSIAMSVMMLWIGWGSPAGVLLFWATSSVIGIAQMTLSRKIIASKEAKRDAARKTAEELEAKPVVVSVVRKTKKKRPTKKS